MPLRDARRLLFRGFVVALPAAIQAFSGGPGGVVFFTSPHGYPGIAGNAGNRGAVGFPPLSGATAFGTSQLKAYA